LAGKMKGHFQDTLPLQILYRVNAGPITKENWTHAAEQGGGMLISEMCHFVDFLIFLTGELPSRVTATCLGLSHADQENRDNVFLNFTFPNGSVGTVLYTTLGSAGCPKEYVEIFGGGKTASLLDFQRLQVWDSNNKAHNFQERVRDKGQATEIAETVAAFKQGSSPIPLRELMGGALSVLAAQEALGRDDSVDIEQFRANVSSEHASREVLV